MLLLIRCPAPASELAGPEGRRVLSHRMTDPPGIHLDARGLLQDGCLDPQAPENHWRAGETDPPPAIWESPGQRKTVRRVPSGLMQNSAGVLKRDNWGLLLRVRCVILDFG